MFSAYVPSGNIVNDITFIRNVFIMKYVVGYFSFVNAPFAQKCARSGKACHLRHILTQTQTYSVEHIPGGKKSKTTFYV